MIIEIQHAPLDVKHVKALRCLQRFEMALEKSEGAEPSTIKSSISLAHPTYANVIQNLNKLKQRGTEKAYKFVYAVALYYTIYMNKLVCLCLDQGKDLRDLINFCGRDLFPQDLFEGGEYQSGRFTFDLPTFACAAKDGNFSNQDTDWSCLASVEVNGKRQPLLVPESGHSGLHFNPRGKVVRFDVFKVLFYQLENHLGIREFIGDLADALQLICNYDIQYLIRKYCLEDCAGEEHEQALYSDWVASFFQTIDAIISGEETAVDDAVREKRRALTEHYAMPPQWLPLSSCFHRRFDYIGSKDGAAAQTEVEANDNVRHTLDAMYCSQKVTHKKVLLSALNSLILPIETAVDGYDENGNIADWWTDVEKDLLGKLDGYLKKEERYKFRTIFFTKDEENVEQAFTGLQELLAGYASGKTSEDDLIEGLKEKCDQLNTIEDELDKKLKELAEKRKKQTQKRKKQAKKRKKQAEERKKQAEESGE